MESRTAVSNFRSCCKALVDIIPPGHHLTDAQESIVLSNLQVVESAIRVSHVEQSTTLYKSRVGGTENIPGVTRVRMEVLVRWKCFCITPWETCQFCEGSGHIDRWMPADLLKYVKNRTYLVLGRRDVETLS